MEKLRSRRVCYPLLSQLMVGCWALIVGFAALAAESNLLRPPAASGLVDFGHSIDAEGSWVVVGAPAEDEASGAVYLFECIQIHCSDGVRIRAPNPENKSNFGAAVSLSDGRLAVGSPGRDDGEVDIFRLQAGQWVHEQLLTALNGDSNERFGAAVALLGDQLMVGAPRANEDAGTAYVFNRGATAWAQAQNLNAANSTAGERFGSAVALSATRAWISAPLRDPDGTGPFYARGAVAAFERIAASWQQTATLTPASAGDGDLFGWSLALLDDYGVIGAPGSSDRSGKAVVMLRQGSLWIESTTLQAPQPRSEDRFGWSVAARPDSLIVGAAFAGAEIEARCGAVVQFHPGVAPGWIATPLRSRRPEPFALLGWAVAATADSVLSAAPTLGQSGGALRFEQQTTVFLDGYEGGVAGCD